MSFIDEEYFTAKSGYSLLALLARLPTSIIVSYLNVEISGEILSLGNKKYVEISGCRFIRCRVIRRKFSLVKKGFGREFKITSRYPNVELSDVEISEGDCK